MIFSYSDFMLVKAVCDVVQAHKSDWATLYKVLDDIRDELSRREASDIKE